MTVKYNVKNGFSCTMTLEKHERFGDYKYVVVYGDYELDKFVLVFKTDDDFTKTTDSDIVSYHDTIPEAMKRFKFEMFKHGIIVHDA